MCIVYLHLNFTKYENFRLTLPGSTKKLFKQRRALNKLYFTSYMFPVYPFINWLHILWSDSGCGFWITKIKDANVEWRLGKKKKETLNEFVLLGTLRICSFNYADLQLDN